MEDDVDDSTKLAEPAFKLLSRNVNRVYCEVCLKSWDKKNRKRAQIGKVDKKNFEDFAAKWSSVDHDYNKVFARTDWTIDVIYNCKPCRSQFWKKDYLESQPPLTEPREDDPPSPPPEPLLQPEPSSSRRCSLRKKCIYQTDRHDNDKKQCIICCSVKLDAKGKKKCPVTIITLRNKDTKKHYAEETLIKFAKLHLKHGTKFKDAAESILLIAGTNSLFTCDVGYHKKCYGEFRGSYWARLDYQRNSSKSEGFSISFHNLCNLVRLHVLCKREIYSLKELKATYDSLRTDQCPILRTTDIKTRLHSVFSKEIQFSSLEGSTCRNRQEYIVPAGESVTSEIISSAYHGGGMPMSALLHASATRLHHEIRETRLERPWPPTPQEILQDVNPFNPTTFNLISWIVEPRAPMDNNGLVKLSSKRKSRKVQQICRNIESLLPNAQPSIDHVLLSLILHRQTGTRDVVDTVHSLGYGVSYTETLFIEDTWSEWDRKQNCKIPANISKLVPTTMVADNIDWKNKSTTGKETHNTNCILIQHKVLSDNSESAKVSLQADYSYTRQNHTSFKSIPIELPKFYFKKTVPKKIAFDKPVDTIKVTLHSVQSSLKTIAWVLCRAAKSNDTTNQRVPAWSGFQSLTCKKPALCEVNVGYLPAITDTPTKYETIYKVLQTTESVMQDLELGYIFLEVDQAIYTKIMDVKFQLHQKNEYDNIIVRMGGFHIILCLMRSIYSRFRGFGFVDVLSTVGGLGGPGTIQSALKGGDVKTGIRLYKLLFESLYRIKIKTLEEASLASESIPYASYLAKIQSVRNDSEFKGLSNLMQDPITKKLLESRGNGEMVSWIDSFLDMIHLLLNVIHFQRTGNWKGYLETIYQFLPYCFALNRNKYARNLTYSYLDMTDLKQRNPDAYHYLENGGFTGSSTGLSHSNIPMDQTIETTINRFSKSTGGINGKTEDQGSCEKWVRLNHYLCALKEYMDKKLGKKKTFAKHIDLGAKRMAKDETHVEMIVSTLTSWVPELYTEDQPLVNICNGRPATQELINTVKSTYSRGETQRDLFIGRLVTYKDKKNDEKLTYHDKISKQKIVRFDDKKKRKKVTSIDADEGQSFAEILSRYDGKILDHAFLVKWPVTKAPWMICDEEEKSRCVSKPIFRNNLQKLNPCTARNAVSGIPVYVVDAMKIVRMISPFNLCPSTFKTWTVALFNYINNLPGSICHIVFDIYPESTDLTRPSKGRYNSDSIGERRYISDLSQHLPATRTAWVDYLSNEQNKHELTNLMIDHVSNGLYTFNGPVYVTKGDRCLLIQDGNCYDVPELLSNHKEADPRLALHAVYASSILPGESICVVSDDTDVFIILLSIATYMKGTLFFRQGKSTGKGIEYHNVSTLAETLGVHCCKNLPAFHALTGCDFTYPFYRRAKYQGFVNMMNLKKTKSRSITVGLLDSLGSEEPKISEITDFVLHTIYNRPIKEKSPSDSRAAMLFVGKGTGKNRKCRSTTQIPPDASSLEMKIRRCNLVAYDWNNCLNGSYISMIPYKSGWIIKGEHLVPLWYEGSNLPSDEEYDKHIQQKFYPDEDEANDNEISDNSSDSESDCDSEDFPVSETYTSSDDDIDDYDDC